MTGDGGCQLISDASAHGSLSCSHLIVQENTVISACTGVDNTATNAAQNFVTIWGVSGKTLKIGAFLSAPAGWTITSITLTSGSVIIYNNG